MEQKNIPHSYPKWQEQIEELLKKHYQGEELAERVKKAMELTDLALAVEIPSGDSVIAVLILASEELYPRAAVYAAFQLGVAYERLENAERA